MTDSRDIEMGRLVEMKAIIDRMRYELQDKVDICYLAWAYSGRPQRTWDTFGLLIHEVSKALNEGHYSFEEKRGAIKLIAFCMDDFARTMGRSKVNEENVSQETRA